MGGDSVRGVCPTPEHQPFLVFARAALVGGEWELEGKDATAKGMPFVGPTLLFRQKGRMLDRLGVIQRARLAGV